MVKAFVFDPYGTLFDVQFVTEITDAAFPGHGDYITPGVAPEAAGIQLAATGCRDLVRAGPPGRGGGAPRDKDPSLSLRASARVATRGRRPPPRPASRPPS